MLHKLKPWWISFSNAEGSFIGCCMVLGISEEYALKNASDLKLIPVGVESACVLESPSHITVDDIEKAHLNHLFKSREELELAGLEPYGMIIHGDSSNTPSPHECLH